MMNIDKIVKGSSGEIFLDGKKLMDFEAITSSMIVLGLDTSLTKTGFAVLQVIDGKAQVVEYGLLKTSAKESDGDRLRSIVNGIERIIRRYPLHYVIPREAGIVRFNLSTKQVFKAHGVTEYALADYEIRDVNIQTVKAWARRITGSPGKRQEKAMIAEAVRIYFDDPEMKLNKEGDEADAIAVALSYLISSGHI